MRVGDDTVVCVADGEHFCSLCLRGLKQSNTALMLCFIYFLWLQIPSVPPRRFSIFPSPSQNGRPGWGALNERGLSRERSFVHSVLSADAFAGINICLNLNLIQVTNRSIEMM